MNEMIAKMRILAKAETILVRLRIRRMVRQASLVLAAALFGFLALVMLNVAFYLYLATRVDPALAALIVGGLDLAIGVFAVVAAGRLDLDPQVKEAEVLRDLASSELSASADRLQAQLNDMGQDIKRIRAAVTGITKPGGTGLTTVFQWLMMFINYLRGKRG